MNNKKYTILLFGESGAGKSTTINALANYLQYKTFDEATAGKFIKVIPSKITLLHPQTYDELTIEDEDRDANERHNDDGNSVTQSAKNYEFNFGDKQICIIDTPGMGDTRGVEVDKKNFKNILKHLKSIETLHAVCFLIKTITTRKTASFEYCLNQMLIHLPRSVCANIMFCFTFSRNSFYGPSDGFATLKGSLASNKLGIEKINLKSGENCFYIDNEAFHYLLAKKRGYPFTSDQAKSYKESWDKSVKQMFNMITQITNFEPFKVELVFKLIDYQNIIKNIVDPIGELESRITIQLRTIEDQKKHSKRFANNLEFQDNLEISEILVEEYKTEFKFIREYIRKLIDFLVMNLNTNCHNLIKLHLNVFTDENQFEELSKRTKFSQDMTATSSNVKIENIIESIRKNQLNQIKISQLQELENKMIDFVHSGNSIRKIMGIEPQKEVNPQKAHITSKRFKKANRKFETKF